MKTINLRVEAKFGHCISLSVASYKDASRAFKTILFAFPPVSCATYIFPLTQRINLLVIQTRNLILNCSILSQMKHAFFS